MSRFKSALLLIGLAAIPVASFWLGTHGYREQVLCFYGSILAVWVIVSAWCVFWI